MLRFLKFMRCRLEKVMIPEAVAAFHALVAKADVVIDETYAADAQAYDAALFSVPAVVPLLAYNLYPLVMDAYHVVVDVISGKTWYSVDGGASRIAELMPVTNGIVVPSVSVAFGTLSGWSELEG